jgi:hypothetical protein
MGIPASDMEVHMAGVNGVASGAASGSSAELAIAYQAAALKKEVQVARDIGTAALTLIQSLVANSDLGQNLDVAA